MESKIASSVSHATQLSYACSADKVATKESISKDIAEHTDKLLHTAKSALVYAAAESNLDSKNHESINNALNDFREAALEVTNAVINPTSSSNASNACDARQALKALINKLKPLVQAVCKGFLPQSPARASQVLRAVAAIATMHVVSATATTRSAKGVNAVWSPLKESLEPHTLGSIEAITNIENAHSLRDNTGTSFYFFGKFLNPIEDVMDLAKKVEKLPGANGLAPSPSEQPLILPFHEEF
ncbi:hypothetical protein EO087_05090 [Dyella sp. M7H15-1]|uniref:hypothetical protein n=1 Tax=Dyella sp. M7H15-1 TaxID=2501295 RepID=UPI0010051BFA|nr:hypothetical protein [Dyella sp. M7H15-1]QAU23431.1 hypothetical protein EO087_05090 [Dyella sp. M7H15-1]